MKLMRKNFELKSFYTGNRIARKPQYEYKIIYHYENGKSVTLDKTFVTKQAANKYISAVIEIAKNYSSEEK